jgi:hypothetical protein
MRAQQQDEGNTPPGQDDSGSCDAQGARQDPMKKQPVSN